MYVCVCRGGVERESVHSVYVINPLTKLFVSQKKSKGKYAALETAIEQPHMDSCWPQHDITLGDAGATYCVIMTQL